MGWTVSGYYQTGWTVNEYIHVYMYCIILDGSADRLDHTVIHEPDVGIDDWLALHNLRTRVLSTSLRHERSHDHQSASNLDVWEGVQLRRRESHWIHY